MRQGAHSRTSNIYARHSYSHPPAFAKASARNFSLSEKLVDQRGVEPLTLALQRRRSTTELLALRPRPRHLLLSRPQSPRRMACQPKHGVRRLVRRGGLEPPTSRLSGVCSNQLSYRRARDRCRPAFHCEGCEGAPNHRGPAHAYMLNSHE